MKAVNVFKQFEIYPEECLELLCVFNLIHCYLNTNHTLRFYQWKKEILCYPSHFDSYVPNSTQCQAYMPS